MADLSLAVRRPFYVHTPRNLYGESLVSIHNNVTLSIKNCCHSHPRPVIEKMGKDYAEAQAKAKEMNDANEAELCAVFI